MRKLYDEIANKELTSYKEIAKSEFEKAKKELSEKEFYEIYSIKDSNTDYPSYQKKACESVNEDEIDTYLLYEILKEQRKTQKNTAVIKGLLVAYALLTLIGAVWVGVALT